MGTTDQALPWGLKIMMIALVTVAVFIYRKPFQHLFSSVGYGVIGSTERAEYSWREASTGFRRASANAAGAAVPTVGANRAARWARRNPAAAAAAGGAAGAAAAAATAGGGGDDATGTGGGPGVGNVRVPSGGAQAADGHAAPRLRPDGASPANGDHADATAGGGGGAGGAGGPANGRSRQWPEAGGGASRAAPPLPLPPRGGSTPAGASAGWARGSAARGGTVGGRSAPPPRAPRPSGNGNGTSGTPVRGTAQPPVRRNASGSAGSASRPAGGNGWFSGGGTVRSDESGAAPPATERSSPMPFWLRPRRRDK
jgi:hypothetical protein